MAREYPRFLFSDPKNTKSKGPFVVHTLEPKFIVRVTRTQLYGEKLPTTTNGIFNLTFLDGSGYSAELKKVTDELFDWLQAQVKAGEITI